MARVLPFVRPASEAASVATAPARRVPLGEVLSRGGLIEPEALEVALAQQGHQDQRLGRILVANRAITSADLNAALSKQSGIGQVDLAASPPDLALVHACDPYSCLAAQAIPWRQVGGTRVIAIGSPDATDAATEACGGDQTRIAFALAPPEDIRRAITAAFSGRLRDDARDRCPETMSCRSREPGRRRWRAATALAFVSAAAVAAPLLALQMLMVWILVANAMTMGLRLVALFVRFSAEKPKPTAEPSRLLEYKKLPQVSILVPLLREENIASRLLEALTAMDYPAALLDIKLVLEEDDVITRAAIPAVTLPPGVEIVTVPADGLRTKPRAMNYALNFCRGEIVGVYDAEDRPDPAQIRAVVAHLRNAPPDVACVQGYLDFYNTGNNWLSRCFTLEYAIWFRVILKGVQRLGIPIPLGGTTVFFRRSVLERIGAWDAHNVTEDADLGMRLARCGYRCEMVASTTWEEATVRVRPWIRQRSRWLKGYAITWATHMRSPRALLRDLGWRGFIGFQVLFLGAITSYLSIPFFWVLWTATAGFDLAFWNTLPQPLMVGFFASMILGQAVMLSIAMIAARDSGRPGLMPWVLALTFYWPLGAVAAYRAVGEIFTRPFHWHKTEHGLSAPFNE